MKLKKINNNFNCGLKCIDELIDREKEKKEKTENTDLLKEAKNACEQAIQGQCPYDINIKDYM